MEGKDLPLRGFQAAVKTAGGEEEKGVEMRKGKH